MHRLLLFPTLRCCSATDHLPPCSVPGQWLEQPGLQMALATPASLSLHCSGELPDGGTTAAARAAQTVDGQGACRPTERRSAPPAALVPGQHPDATQHPSHHCPLLQIHIPPSCLCSARKQRDATVPILPVLGHAAEAEPQAEIPASPAPASTRRRWTDCTAWAQIPISTNLPAGRPGRWYLPGDIRADHQDTGIATCQRAWLRARLGGTKPPRLPAWLQAGGYDNRASQTHPGGSCLTSHADTCPDSTGTAAQAEGPQFTCETKPIA